MSCSTFRREAENPRRTTNTTSDIHNSERRCSKKLYIDKNITMTDLIADIRAFLSRYFGFDDIELRIRPSYFPFTDPSIEVDMKWKNGKWLEIMGAGMVHPNVLRNCNIDPDTYQGFAFGFGWDRLAMLKYGLNDIRQFYDNDVRWLKSAGF